VEMIEPRILSDEILKPDWGTWCFLNTLHQSTILHKDSLWDRAFFSRWG
jgi:hypothetical protein